MDFVLIMSVNPGFGGQKFLPLVYDKIKKLQEYATTKNTNIEIEIDGGVNNTNAKLLEEAGADILVAGSYVFGNSNYKNQINSLK